MCKIGSWTPTESQEEFLLLDNVGLSAGNWSDDPEVYDFLYVCVWCQQSRSTAARSITCAVCLASLPTPTRCRVPPAMHTCAQVLPILYVYVHRVLCSCSRFCIQWHGVDDSWQCHSTWQVLFTILLLANARILCALIFFSFLFFFQFRDPPWFNPLSLWGIPQMK